MQRHAGSGAASGAPAPPRKSATTPFSVPGAAPSGSPAVALRRRAAGSASVSVSVSVSAGARKPKPKPSKLRVGRERRQRERSADADDELDQRFSALSVAAPEFVPSFAMPTVSSSASAVGPRAPAAPVAASASGKPRSLAFVTDRNPARRVTATVQEQRPRRQRIGAVGAKTAASAGKPALPAGASATTLRRQKQQKDKLLLSKADAPSSRAVGASAATASSLKVSPRTGAKPPSAAEPPLLGPRRPRSNSGGSNSDDEVFVSEVASPAIAGSSAFSSTLSLFSQQKHIPIQASRDVVIDTIFDALFAPSQRSKNDSGTRFSAFGDDTGTDTEGPNEDFVKRGLAATLFKDHIGKSLGASVETPQEAIDRFITPTFLHSVVSELRFEDYRTASARLDILRAVHKACPSKRLQLARALTDATLLRVEYVRALTATAHSRSIEKNRVMHNHPHDHGHHFTELLRYAIERVNETLDGFGGQQLAPSERHELLRNYMASLVALWRAHWLDPAGSDDEELISCAGQFVAYLPEITVDLLTRLLRAWPTTFPSQQVIAIRMCARIIMSGPPLPSLDSTRVLQRRVFTRLAQAVQSSHVDVAKEALAFTGCQFVMVHFLATDADVYKVMTQAFHANATGHWHQVVRTTSEANFDRALDFAA